MSSCSLACRRLGSRSLVEWVVRRVSEAEQLDNIAVVACPDAAAAVREFAPPDVAVLAEAGDQLTRTQAAIDHFQADAIIRVRIDNPFIDPVFIDRLAAAARRNPDCDFAGFSGKQFGSDATIALGFTAEWYSSRAFTRLSQETDEDARIDPFCYIHSNPEEFQLRWLPIPDALDRPDLRLRIDVEEDWDHAQVIYEALGPDELDWQGVAGLLDRQPAIRERMATLNQSRQSA
ncbi:MAG: NTP transferase domain-containing protein [Pirellulaceae bacterium]|nr:NTP transferase domain-containing protein [Pirellulaceae bacterium]